MSNEIEKRHKSMKMNIRQVQIVLPTFNVFSSLLANKLFDLVFITEPHRVGE